jgi:hypothetical protein
LALSFSLLLNVHACSSYANLVRTTQLDLQHTHDWIRLEQFQYRWEVLIRHYGIFGPYLAISCLGIPVNLEFLNRLFGAVSSLVLRHDCKVVVSQVQCAVWRVMYGSTYIRRS